MEFPERLIADCDCHVDRNCFFLERHNGPASAAPCQEGHFWKRSETKKRILRVAQKTQIRAALQELLESLPDRRWRGTMRSKCAKTGDSENPVSE